MRPPGVKFAYEEASGKCNPALLVAIIAITADIFRWHYAKKGYLSAPEEKSSGEAPKG
jgi:hypothetical protein